MKKIVVLLFTALLALALFACDGCDVGNKSINLAEEFPENAEFECGTDAEFPEAFVVDGGGNKLEDAIVYNFISPTEISTETAFPAMTCNEAGTWKLVIKSGDLSVEYTFTVIDTSKPIITITKVPIDLFVGETQMGDLPAVTIDDFSDIEVVKTLKFEKADGTVVDWEYNAMNDRYNVSERGVFTYTVTATDIHDNSDSKSVSWRVKDASWSDENLATSFLADYDEEEYYNYVRAGDINPYWNIKDYKEEYLESYKGANGVFKLSVSFTGNNLNAMKFKLAKPVTLAELEGKYLAVRIYTDGIGLDNTMRFGGAQKIVENGTSCATVQKTLVKGEWTTYYLSVGELKERAFYSVKDDETSPITDIQLAFCRSDTIQYIDYYIDCITIADKLPKVENITESEGTVVWNAVDGATGYKVTEGLEVTVVESETYELKAEKTYITVVALGTGVLTLDSELSGAVFGLVPQDGYVASFDDALYSYLVSDNVYVGNETSGYIPRSLVVEYNSEAKTVKAQVGAGSWGICTAVAVVFPQSIDLKAGDKLVFRMSVAATGVTKFSVKDLAYTVDFGTYDVKDGMADYYFNVSKDVNGLNGIEFTVVCADGIDTVEFVFDKLSLATALGTPSLNYDVTNGQITWAAVTGATGYAVSVNGGEETTVTDLFYTYPTEGHGTVSVRAIGDNVNYLDGESAEIAYDSRVILGTVSGFSFDFATAELAWNAVENATGYTVKIGESTTDVTDCKYTVTDTDYVEVYVCAKGDGINYADGAYVLGFTRDLSLAENTIADFGENYKLLINTDVSLGGDENNLKSTSVKMSHSADGLAVEAAIGKWGVTVSFRVKFPQSVTIGATDEQYVLRLKIEGTTSDIANFRLMNYSDSNDLRAKGTIAAAQVGQFIDLVFTLKAGQTYEGIQFYCSSTTTLTFTFKHIMRYFELGTPVLTEDKENCRVNWQAIDNAVAYEYSINGGAAVRTTDTYYQYASDEKGSITVKAIGNGVNITDGELSEALRYNLTVSVLDTPVLGVNGAGGNIVWDAVENAGGYSVTVGDAQAVTVTDTFFAFQGSDVTVVSVKALGDDIEFTESNAASITVGKAGSAIVKVVGNVKIISMSYTESKAHLQYEFDSAVWKNSSFNTAGIKLTVNGVDFTNFTVTFGNESKINFNGSFPTATSTGYPVPLLVVKAGSLIAQGDEAYMLTEDATTAFATDADNWVNTKVAVISNVSWTENAASSIQIKFTSDVWSAVSAKAEGLKLEGNGVALTASSAVGDTAAHVRIGGTFPTTADSANGYFLPTLVIKAGSVLYQTSPRNAIIFTEDYTLVLAAGNWVLKNSFVNTAIRKSWSENANSIQFALTDSVSFASMSLVDQSGLKIKFNGQYINAADITLTLFFETCQHFFLRGGASLSLPTEGGNGYDLPTIEIEAGSTVCQAGGSGFVITNTLILQFTDGKWETVS